MPKDKYHYFNENEDVNISIADITEEERTIFKLNVEKQRHFIEMFKLYKMLRYNQELLSSNFLIHENDTVEFLGDIELSDEELEIRLNTLFVNFLASGKSLTESMDTYLKVCFGDKGFEEFRKQVSGKIYESYFSYKCLNYLRNYSQHGHVPVEIVHNRALFNLDDIINKPHTSKMNTAVQEEMKKIRDDILQLYGDNPFISYTYIITDISFFVIKIYYEFLKFIKEDFRESYEKVKEVVTKKPYIVSDGLIYYEETGNMTHCFDPEFNNMGLFSETKRDVRAKLTVEEVAFNKVKGRREERNS